MRNSLRVNLTICIATLSFFSSSPAVHAEAKAPRVQSACVNQTSGQISIRRRCRSFETPLLASQLGSAGKDGVPGIQGERGPAGPQGPQGVPGMQGARGLTGATGPQGPIGLTGPKGDEGARGPTGPQGATGSQGHTGATGAQGPQGPVGPAGIRGVSAFDPIPSGETVFGVVGGDYFSSGANSDWGTTSSLPGIPPRINHNVHIVVRNNSAVDNDCGGQSCLSDEERYYSVVCEGSAEAPSAPPGWLCIYPTVAANAWNIRATSIPNDGGYYGFLVRWASPASGGNAFRGVWAYTAP